VLKKKKLNGLKPRTVIPPKINGNMNSIKYLLLKNFNI